MAVNSKYNFHSHTYRCGHASGVPDSCYIDEALKRGYTKYGITDHIPVHPIFFGDSSVRMHDSDKYEYLESIDHLKDIYGSAIEIFSGFEAEYDEIIEDYLCDLKDSCDYMILGQHYVLNKDIRHSPDYPLEYAKKVCAAIESGIFDIVAHPDIFMQFRFSIPNVADRNLFMLNAVVASQMICEKAKEFSIPLELNLGGTYVFSKDILKGEDENTILSPERIAEINANNARYPTCLFWQIASEVGNDVVVGIDAHFVEDIGLRDDKLKKIGTYINLDSLHFLPDSYDPVTSRRNNKKLLEAYKRTRNKTTSVEGRLVESFLREYLDDEPFSKHKAKTAMIRKFRDTPPNRLFDIGDTTDFYTYKKREELVQVLKDSTRKLFGKNMDKEEYIEAIKSGVDNYYRTKKNIIDIDSKGNIISFGQRDKYGK